jgi:hypothetical protein
MQQKDPNDLDQHTPGAKLDAGKNRLGLVINGFSKALAAVGEVGTYGANKYTPNGWLSVVEAEERYTDAMYRHLLAEASGELKDPETEIHHAAHACWNALARLHFILEKSDGETKSVEPFVGPASR